MARQPEHLAGREGDVGEDGHVREKVEALEHDADVLAQPVQVDPASRRLLAVDPDGAPVDLFECVDAAKKRRLAAAGGADQADDVVLVDVQVDAAQHLVLPEALVHAVDLEEGHRSAARSRPGLARHQPVGEASQRDRDHHERHAGGQVG
jgi:hypothetical protein